MKRWLLHQDGIAQRHSLKGNPRARGYEVIAKTKTGAYIWQKTKEEEAIYQGETETAPSDPTDWEGETEYEPYA